MVVRPVILSGGAGTRLWPVSRKNFPKQLLPIAVEQSMFAETLDRVRGSEFAPPIIVAAEEHRFFIKDQVQKSGFDVETILLEPCGRNTSAAAGLAAEWLRTKGRDELLLLMPSDHVIGNLSAFLSAIESGLPLAENGHIVTFGIIPEQPNTEYGYIEAAETPIAGDAYSIKTFAEKPDAKTAARYLQNGNFYWNSGIFLVKSSILLSELQRFLPESLAAISRSIAKAAVDGAFVRPESNAFSRARNISIDHGLMEKTSLGVVVPVEMGWSDVGSWAAVWKLGPKDVHNNVTQGDVIAIDTRDSLLRNNDGGVVTAIGLERMVVIALRDAVLVAPLNRAADVKMLVEKLDEEGREISKEPSKVARPWGSYETVDRGPGFQVKRIVVQPGHALSLQMHYQRSEHWIVVRGTAEVTVGEEVSILHENESTYISAGTRHRLSNPGKFPLELVEVQCGSYLGEDDIVRLSDEYGRS